MSALSLVRKWLLVDLLGDDFRKLSSYSSQTSDPEVVLGWRRLMSTGSALS